jgi:L-lactate dehydrogenase complex protein LldE
MVEKIQLFITCILDTLYPEVGKAVVAVLERSGVKIEFPADQTCCGQPAFNAGMRTQAREMAIHTIRVFEASPAPVVIPSGSCAAMIRHSYPELFKDDPAWLKRSEELAERTYELSEFLVDVQGVTDFGARFAGPVTYHSSCHLLRELGVDRQPRALLSSVQDARYPDGRPLEFRELPFTNECCGFGGVFSVEHAQISTAMLERKIANIEATQAPVVVVGDAGCMTHINGGMHRKGKTQRVMHIAEILASL